DGDGDGDEGASMNDEHIEIADGSTRVTVVPALGALVTSFKVGDRELLYADESTEGPAGTSRRGGVPVLFPSPGKLKNDLFEAEGRYGKLKNHGFARDMRFT